MSGRERLANASPSRKGKGCTLTFVNNATLPINLLALPTLMTLYARTENYMMPGATFSFFPGMGAYDIHAVITDGQNNWTSVGETTWGLTKYGTGYVVGIAVGAGAAGTIATTATIFVTGILAAVVAPPALPFIAFGTFWGTAFFSSMTVYALTDKAMDIVKDKIVDVVSNETRDARVLSELQGFSDLPNSHPDHLFLFDTVVTEEPVRAAFALSYPGVDTSRLVITRRQAEIYFTSMVSDFKEWAVIKGYTRSYLIKGGFTQPERVPGTTWRKTGFEPLVMGEIKRGTPGLCQKTLVIEYAGGNGTEGVARVRSDWDKVPVAEKSVPGDRADQECRKRYVAMCERSSLRVYTECRLSGLSFSGVDVTEPVWDEVKKEDRSLSSWHSRRVTLAEGDRDLRFITTGVTSRFEGESDDEPLEEITDLTALSFYVEAPSDK